MTTSDESMKRLIALRDGSSVEFLSYHGWAVFLTPGVEAAVVGLIAACHKYHALLPPPVQQAAEDAAERILADGTD